MNHDYINKAIKFIIFFFLLYFFVNNIINNIDKMEKINGVLLICLFAVILYYILDQYYPSCYL